MHHRARLRRLERLEEITRSIVAAIHWGSCWPVKGTAANADERAQLRSLAQDVAHGTGDTVTLACGALGYQARARDDGTPLQRIKRKDATSDVVLLPRRCVVAWLRGCVVACSGGWVKRFRRWARDDAR